MMQRLKALYLRSRVITGLRYADVISAESAFSLSLIQCERRHRLFLTVNGNDDELSRIESQQMVRSVETAVVVGTAAYKKLHDSFAVFSALRSGRPALKLLIIGNPDWVPRSLRNRESVVIKGYLPREAVIDELRTASFYISTTCIEGSYNAAAEGVYLAKESYISDIGPHRELLRDREFAEIVLQGTNMPLLQVQRDKLTGAGLKTWDTVIREMLDRYESEIRDREGLLTNGAKS
jgi:glycosyltransferase involved in cell wall biosynthesis